MLSRANLHGLHAVPQKQCQVNSEQLVATGSHQHFECTVNWAAAKDLTRLLAVQIDLSCLPPETCVGGVSLAGVVRGCLDANPDTCLTAHEVNTMLFFIKDANQW